MITPRSTRLVRVPDLRGFRDAIADLASGGDPLAARDRLIIVPTRAAAAQLTRTIDERLLQRHGAVLLPELVSRAELYTCLADRLAHCPRLLNPFEREVLLTVSSRTAEAAGARPPFRLRPALVAAMLDFYDSLQRYQKDVATFERLVLGTLEPSAESDRGAERLVRQTRFLAAAFREFEQRCSETGALDEHSLRRALIATPSRRPWRHVIATVLERSVDEYGLWPCDFDLFARLPGLERIDVVVTDECLAGAMHERMHALFPGIEECRAAGCPEPRGQPVLVVPSDTGFVHTARDREDEVAVFARRVKALARQERPPALDRVAFVVRRPLPYVYLTRDVLQSAGIPCQMFDALPLAAEPFAAALDLVFSAVTSNFTRTSLVALLGSPHFSFEHRGHTIGPMDVAALDRALSQSGYLGDVAALKSFAAGAPPPCTNAAAAAVAIAQRLAVLREPAPAPVHLHGVQQFIAAQEVLPASDDPLRERLLRARGAILGALASLRMAHAAYDTAPGEFATLAATIRRWIEGQTFAPRAGERGVHIIDADSARYADFECVQLAGLIEGEWPDRPRRDIFYSPGLLRDLGWRSEVERIDAARAGFRDLLRLPSKRLLVSTFSLENDNLVAPSSFVDEVEQSGLVAVDEPIDPVRIFEFEALGLSPPRPDVLRDVAKQWAQLRLKASTDMAPRGMTTGHAPAAFSVSALERYQDCPFKFFAAEVLRLEEPLEDEPGLSPRERGRFIHEVFQRFFQEWDRRDSPAITSEQLDDAREVFLKVVEPLLARLPDAEAALERTRLFGSAIVVGIVDQVLALEASRPEKVVERWLEYRLEGAFTLGADDRRVSLKGVADRIDLFDGRRLRVIDYKSGYAPNVKRALQVPVYALCASERLAARGGEPWAVDEAAYIVLSGKRTLVPVIRRGSCDQAAILGEARQRLFDIVDSIGRGEFPVRPYDPMICSYCAFASVCRKDYVDAD